MTSAERRSVDLAVFNLTGASQVERLRVASVLVRSVRAELNTGHGVCDACDCRVYENFAERSAAQALEGASGRVDRTIGVLKTLASELGEARVERDENAEGGCDV